MDSYRLLVGVEFLVDQVVHTEFHSIMQDLKAHNVSTGILWCGQHGSRLRRLASSFEFRLRLQEFVELVRSDRRLEAIQYAQVSLTPLAMHCEDPTEKQAAIADVQEAMATLAYKSPESCGVGTYSRLFASERWDALIAEFRKTHRKVYGLHDSPSLCIALHAGLSSLNTRACRRTREAKRRCGNGDASSDAGEDERDDEEETIKRHKATRLFERKLIRAIKKEAEKTAAPATGRGNSDISDASGSAASPPLCPTCSDVGGQLVDGLPFAHHPHSRLVCRVARVVMNEHNPPVVLPNGYVYSRKAIDEMTRARDGVIVCAETAENFDLGDVKQVFII